MKKNKLIICSIASILAIGTLGTSIALYVETSNELNISINGSTKADGTLKLEEITEGEQTLEYNKNYTVEYKLINEANTNTYTQDVTVGDLAITITAENGDSAKISEALSHITVTGNIEGYNPGSFYTQTDEERLPYSTLRFTNNGDTITCNYDNIAFKNDGSQSIKFTFASKTIDVDEYIEYVSGVNFTYEISLTSHKSIDEDVSLCGSFDNSQWNLSPKYLFVTHIDGTGALKEFKYQGLTLNPGDQFKLRTGDGSTYLGYDQIYIECAAGIEIIDGGGYDHNFVYKGETPITCDFYYTPTPTSETKNKPKLYVGLSA